MRAREAVQRLEAIQPHENTQKMKARASEEALRIVLSTVPDSVREAYEAAIIRCT